jgi:uncharacterized repeat protein (TIGR01451 family)
LVLGLLLLVLPGAAGAATLTVTRTDDPASATCVAASCTLRAAIALANTDGGDDTIVLPAGTYQLTSAGGGQLTIKASMTIAGAGARDTTITPAPASRIVQIEGNGNVALDDLTLTGASVAAEGGAAQVEGKAAVAFVRDTLSDNDVEVGGIHDGGAIEDGSTGPLLIEASTLSGNNGYNGGAIYSSAPTTIVNSTLVDNRAGTPTTNGDGGAMQVTKAVLINDTITGNECFNGAGCGGAFVGSVSAADTIIAGNKSNTGSITNCGGTATVTGPDIEDGTDCGFTTGGSKQVDPKLGLLANNGGPTDTVLPGPSSPAIDAGTNATCATRDQRGGARTAPGPGACDIGAVEVNSLADVAISGSVSPSSLLVGGAVVYTLEATNLGPDPALSTTVQNLLPAGATFAGAIASTGNCSGTTALTCALGTLPSGATATINVSATLTTVGTATDVASASAPATDLVPANNRTAILASVLAPVAPGIPAPTLTAVSEAHSTWRAGSKLATISGAKHKAPTGTVFAFTLNTPAQVSFTFTHSLSGRKTKGKCMAQTRRNRRARPCKRTVTSGALSFAAHSGANIVSFQGRLSKSKLLRPGRYAVQIVASNSAGHSTAQTLDFTIVR